MRKAPPETGIHGLWLHPTWKLANGEADQETCHQAGPLWNGSLISHFIFLLFLSRFTLIICSMNGRLLGARSPCLSAVVQRTNKYLGQPSRLLPQFPQSFPSPLRRRPPPHGYEARPPPRPPHTTLWRVIRMTKAGREHGPPGSLYSTSFLQRLLCLGSMRSPKDGCGWLSSRTRYHK